MPTRNVNLTDHYDQFVEDQVGRPVSECERGHARGPALAGASDT